MNLRSSITISALILPFLTTLGGCSAISSMRSKESDGLSQVDELLTRVEQVNVEALVSADRAEAALASLQALTAPEFEGDAVASHKELLVAIDRSSEQAASLSASVAPMKEVATRVLEHWTEDLEVFGNTRLRQRSQERMEGTRARYEAIVTAAVSAQIAYDAFNSDLQDHALFLGHDLNASAISEIAAGVQVMGERARELDARLETCAQAAHDFVAATALHGELATATASADPAPEESNLRAGRTARASGLAPATAASSKHTDTPPASVVQESAASPKPIRPLR